MSKYIPDISSRRWVAIAPQRTSRPDNFVKNKDRCPFCPGNEDMSTGELMRFGTGEADKPGWTLRVIPNRFPITDYHEIVIHSPDPEADFEIFTLSQVELILKAYKARYNFYKKKGSVMIFCNHGEHAGASIKHPHSQITVVPFQITLDILVREPIVNVVDENNFFHVYCPDFSQWPYEVWLAPKKEVGTFGDITDEEISDMAQLLQNILKRLHKIYNERTFSMLPFGFNFYIYPKENWYMRIIPRFVHRGGFELGTGLSVNIVDPSTAALDLKEVRIDSILNKLEKY